MKLSKVIFWDTNPDSVDFQEKARYVISRVVTYGTIDDWNAIKAFYGLDKIKKEMLQERYLDPKALSFLCCIFDLPKEEFRCYNEKQYCPPHMSY